MKKRDKFSIELWLGQPRPIGTHWNAIVAITNGGSTTSGHRLTAINFRFDEHQVTVILKKEARGKPMIAFVRSADFKHALWLTAVNLQSKKMKWRPDEWEMRRRLESK